MIHVALIGLGFIGKDHLKAYAKMNHVVVKAVYTRSGLIDDECKDYFAGYVTNEYNDILEDDTIDVVDICLPTFLHERFAIEAAHAKKHIICEKPIALSIDAAQRMIQAAEKNNVRLFVGHVLRFWPGYKEIKQLSMTEPVLNEIEFIHAQRLGQGPTWSKWFLDPKKSGGALYDLHIHDIDFISYLLGSVTSIYAVGKQNEYGSWNHIMTQMTFENGAKAFVEASHRMPESYPFTMRFSAHNQLSAIDFSIQAGENIEHIQDKRNTFLFYKDGKQNKIELPQEEAFYIELSYFISCIKNNEENTIVPNESVLQTLRILEAIEQSLEEKKVINFTS